MNAWQLQQCSGPSGLVCADVPDPKPGPGEVLVKTLACGICGSDLHALKHAERLVEGARRSGGPWPACFPLASRLSGRRMTLTAPGCEARSGSGASPP